MIKKIEKNFGIYKRSLAILHKKLGFNIKYKDYFLNENQSTLYIKSISKIKQNRTLKELISTRISFLKTIKSYKGLRHLDGLPVRGQRTHTNARTVKKIYKR